MNLISRAAGALLAITILIHLSSCTRAPDDIKRAPLPHEPAPTQYCSCDNCVRVDLGEGFEMCPMAHEVCIKVEKDEHHIVRVCDHCLCASGEQESLNGRREEHLFKEKGNICVICGYRR